MVCGTPAAVTNVNVVVRALCPHDIVSYIINNIALIQIIPDNIRDINDNQDIMIYGSTSIVKPSNCIYNIGDSHM